MNVNVCQCMPMNANECQFKSMNVNTAKSIVDINNTIHDSERKEIELKFQNFIFCFRSYDHYKGHVKVILSSLLRTSFSIVLLEWMYLVPIKQKWKLMKWKKIGIWICLPSFNCCQQGIMVSPIWTESLHGKLPVITSIPPVDVVNMTSHDVSSILDHQLEFILCQVGRNLIAFILLCLCAVIEVSGY